MAKRRPHHYSPPRTEGLRPPRGLRQANTEERQWVCLQVEMWIRYVQQTRPEVPMPTRNRTITLRGLSGACFSWGDDTHVIVMDTLNVLWKFQGPPKPPFKHHPMRDAPDKYWAYLARLARTLDDEDEP